MKLRMPFSIPSLMRKTFDIRPGEGLKAVLMFSYVFLLISTILILKALRDSLLLSNVGISKLPMAFLLIAVFAALIINVYTSISRRFRLNRLITGTTLFWILCLAVFRVLLAVAGSAQWLYYILYVWVALYSVLVTSQFWLLANYVFDAREAKRLFGFVGAGGISGGIFGGYLTSLAVRTVGSDNLLYFCMVFLAVCLVIFRTVWKRAAKSRYKARLAQEKRIAARKDSEGGYRSVMKSPHLAILAGIVGIGVIVSTLVHYQYSAIASRMIENKDELTAFFGFWLSNLSIASLVIQLFATSRMLKRFGVIASLFLLPMGVLTGAISILMQPALWSAILLKVSDGGFKQSIYRSGVELLYLPVPSQVKNRAKVFIDVFVDSLATGVAGLLLMGIAAVSFFSEQAISVLIVAFILLWVYLIVRMRKEYVGSFRTALDKRSINMDELTVNLNDAAVFDALVHTLETATARRQIYALQLIESARDKRFIPYYLTLLENGSAEVAIQIFQNIATFNDERLIEAAGPLVLHSNHNLQAAAVHYLVQRWCHDSAQLGTLLNHSELRVRGLALFSCGCEARQNRDLAEKIDFEQLIDSFELEPHAHEAQRRFCQIQVARTIGAAGNPLLYGRLKPLLQTKDLAVLEAAVMAAGQTHHTAFAPMLISYLADLKTRHFAREALILFGNDILPSLEQVLGDASQDRRIRLQIPVVLARVGTQEAGNVILAHLHQNDLRLRAQLIRSLTKLAARIPALHFDRSAIENAVLDELARYATVCRTWQVLKIAYSGGSVDVSAKLRAARELLLRALGERLTENTELFFRLLGLLHTGKDMENAFNAMMGDSTDQRANALEFLDNTLNRRLKSAVMPVVESVASGFEPGPLADGNDADEGEIDRLMTLLHGDGYWLKACTLFVCAESAFELPEALIEPFTVHPDFKVREAAGYALARRSFT